MVELEFSRYVMLAGHRLCVIAPNGKIITPKGQKELLQPMMEWVRESFGSRVTVVLHHDRLEPRHFASIDSMLGPDDALKKMLRCQVNTFGFTMAADAMLTMAKWGCRQYKPKKAAA